MIMINSNICFDFRSELEHEADDIELNYFFVAMSGGKSNTRMVQGVGIPKGVACEYEFDCVRCFYSSFDALG